MPGPRCAEIQQHGHATGRKRQLLRLHEPWAVPGLIGSVSQVVGPDAVYTGSAKLPAVLHVKGGLGRAMTAKVQQEACHQESISALSNGCDIRLPSAVGSSPVGPSATAMPAGFPVQNRLLSSLRVSWPSSSFSPSPNPNPNCPTTALDILIPSPRQHRKVNVHLILLWTGGRVGRGLEVVMVVLVTRNVVRITLGYIDHLCFRSSIRARIVLTPLWLGSRELRAKASSDRAPALLTATPEGKQAVTANLAGQRAS